MRKLPLIAAGLLLVSTAVLADMYQDAKNAKLPEAQNNLGIPITVKSEGGTPPNEDLVTRFYTFNGINNGKQFEVGSRPAANEYAIEQAGLGAPGGIGIGQGATRVCTAPYSNNAVNCNYVAGGRDGKHLFGNGASKLGEFVYGGTGGGANMGWLRFTALDNSRARLESYGDAGASDVDLELNNKGFGVTTFSNSQGMFAKLSSGTLGPITGFFRALGTNTGLVRVGAISDTLSTTSMDLEVMGFGAFQVKNGQGTLAKIASGTVGPTTAWPELLGSNDGQVRIFADSDTLTNIQMNLFAAGNSPLFVGNANGGIAEFSAPLSAVTGLFNFTAAAGAGPVTISATAGHGVRIAGHRMTSRQTINTTYNVPVDESGYRYHNTGATGATTFQLPATDSATVPDMQYCFAVDAAQSVIVKAATGDKIAIAATNSATGGQISSATPFASICIETHKTGQWTTWATADKAQWTSP